MAGRNVRVSGLEEKKIDTVGGEITYLEAGTGPVLMLLHGIGSGAASWQAQLEAFSDRFRVIAWNAPGYGGSSRLAPSAPKADDYAAALGGFLDALGVDACHVVGHSLGALMGCAFARRWPTRVLSLMIGDPAAGYGDATEELRDQRRTARIGLLDTLGPEGLARERHANLLSEDAPQWARDRVREVMSQIRPDGYRQAVEMLMQGTIHADAAEIDLPVTVAVGGVDTVTPPDGCRKIAGSFAHARFEILPGLGHASYVEGPDAFNALLSEHLEATA
jgi:pimeloyl-ACP methyl ester carboxylesterase